MYENVVLKVKNLIIYNSFNLMLFVCYLLFYEEDKFEIFDDIDEKYNEIDDRVNIEILVEDKKSESDINDGKGEEIFI